MTDIHVIAIASSKGGVGKTTVTVGLGGEISSRGHKTYVADTDDQDRGSIEQWLDATKDNVANLAWSKADPTRITRDSLAGLGYRYVLIDTPPRIGAAEVAAVLELADLVLIPFLPDEDDIAVQSFRSIEAIRDVPCRAVANDALTVTLASKAVQETKARMATAGLETIGSIRHLKALRQARTKGQLPIEIPGTKGQQVAGDFAELADNIEKVLTHA